MADSNLYEFCRLCLCCKLIQLESLQKNEVMQKVRKYLLIKVEQSSIGVCFNCYNSLEDFHKFYEGVHSAQKNFHTFQSPGSSNLKPPADTERWNNNVEEKRDEQCEDDGIKKCEMRELKVEKEIEQELKSCTEKLVEESGDFTVEKKVKKDRVVKDKEKANELEKKMMEFYNVRCEKCEDLSFKSLKMLSRHYSRVHNTQGYVKCCKRNIRINDRSYLKSHMLKHLEPDSCRCTICGKQLSSTVTLKHHMILHKPTEERPFQCNECDKRFCCKNDLKNHEKAIHLPENEREDFICDVCGKVFQKVANLRYHHSTVHLQERKYVCELCAKCFTTQSGLRTHRNAAHNTRGPIQCQECSKWLKNEDTFQKHLQLHQNNSYPCNQCSKICNSYTSLRSHMVKHSKERPHSCEICQKSFKTKTHLKNHSVQHSGGSSFKCPFCTKTFVNMSNYYTHRKRMHLNENSLKLGNNLQNENINVPVRVSTETSENNLGFDYKILRDDVDGVTIPVGENEVSVVRQNIIVSPINVKYL